MFLQILNQENYEDFDTRVDLQYVKKIALRRTYKKKVLTICSLRSLYYVALTISREFELLGIFKLA
jgi:hypothetical protein